MFNLGTCVIPYCYQGHANQPARSHLGLRLKEDDEVAAFELFIAHPEQRRFGLLAISVVLPLDAPPGALISPFPDQGPALKQVLLQVEMVEAQRAITLRRNLHVDSHWIVDGV